MDRQLTNNTFYSKTPLYQGNSYTPTSASSQTTLKTGEGNVALFKYKPGSTNSNYLRRDPALAAQSNYNDNAFNTQLSVNSNLDAARSNKDIFPHYSELFSAFHSDDDVPETKLNVDPTLAMSYSNQTYSKQAPLPSNSNHADMASLPEGTIAFKVPPQITELQKGVKTLWAKLGKPESEPQTNKIIKPAAALPLQYSSTNNTQNLSPHVANASQPPIAPQESFYMPQEQQTVSYTPQPPTNPVYTTASAPVNHMVTEQQHSSYYQYQPQTVEPLGYMPQQEIVATQEVPVMSPSNYPVQPAVPIATATPVAPAIPVAQPVISAASLAQPDGTFLTKREQKAAAKAAKEAERKARRAARKLAEANKPKKKKLTRNKMITFAVLAIGGFMLFNPGGGSSGTVAGAFAAVGIENRVEQLAQVPADETPQILQISDEQKVKQENSSFFADAVVGDYLLIYSDTAVLYTPRYDKILKIGSLSSSNQ